MICDIIYPFGYYSHFSYKNIPFRVYFIVLYLQSSRSVLLPVPIGHKARRPRIMDAGKRAWDERTTRFFVCI